MGGVAASINAGPWLTPNRYRHTRRSRTKRLMQSSDTQSKNEGSDTHGILSCGLDRVPRPRPRFDGPASPDDILGSVPGYVLLGSCSSNFSG